MTFRIYASVLCLLSEPLLCGSAALRESLFWTRVIENTEGRAPQDIDVITFFYPPDPDFSATVAANFPILADHPQTKAQFHTDHYLMNLAAHPIRTVDMTAYWCGLFSHRRDGVWKGLLRIEIGHNQGDDDVRNWIAAQP